MVPICRETSVVSVDRALLVVLDLASPSGGVLSNEEASVV